MTGIADRVDFWSGEEGHDYAYAEKDRMQEPDMTMNFMMLLNSGTQRRPAKVMYSTDFDGTMTQEGILAATWTDVSDRFDMEKPVHGVDPALRVVAVSARGELDAADFTARGFAGCLRKPFAYGELLAVVPGRKVVIVQLGLNGALRNDASPSHRT